MTKRRPNAKSPSPSTETTEEKSRRPQSGTSATSTGAGRSFGRPKRQTESTPAANAELLLLQSLALRLGQEAARQNGLRVSRYHDLPGDPSRSALARLTGPRAEGPTETLRLTVDVEVSTETGAIVAYRPRP